MRSDLDRPCVVMVAPNGARRGKEDHPAIPLTPEELAADAAACAAAGATAIHLHARDASGAHTLDPDVCRRFLDAVREAVGERMVVQLTTEAVGRYTPEDQMRLMRELRPEAVSLAPRELAGDAEEPPPAVRSFLDWMAETGISPQYILYAPDEVARFQRWRERGLIPQPRPFVLFVLGRYLAEGESVEPRALLPFLERHPSDCPWAVCAFGREETACLLLAAMLGGHVRVGFENSLWHGNGGLAAGNAEKVEALVAGLRLAGRRLAGPDETRRLFADAAGGGDTAGQEGGGP